MVCPATMNERDNLQSVTVRIKEDTSRRPYGLPTKSEYITHPDRRSDRPISFQEAMWERLAIRADFTALKHRLADVRARFAAAAYYHIGDTEIDERFPREAGFHFLRAEVDAHRRWGPELFAG